MNKKTGRNDPCPCGSGSKYKKCCLEKDANIRGRTILETPRSRRAGPPPLVPNLELLLLGKAQRDHMRLAGEFNARLMDHVRGLIRPGAKPKEIDDFVRTFTKDHGHEPAPLGYDPQGDGPFPASCCISINDVICHGVPLVAPELKEGDIVNVDLTTIVHGWHGDQSETFLVGEVPDHAKKLVQCAFDSMWLAIDALKPNCRVSDIGDAIVARAAQDGFSVVEHFTGHGVGRQFHNNLAIPHYPTKAAFLTRLPPGITFTIEPMINEGLKDPVLEGDGWTVRTADGLLSAQFEHTILMTEEGPEVLTMTENGPKKGHRFA